MKRLTKSFLLLALSAVASLSQSSFPGINITPNSGQAGKISLRDAANANPAILQYTTLTSPAGSGAALNIVNSTGTTGLETETILPAANATYDLGSSASRYETTWTRQVQNQGEMHIQTTANNAILFGVNSSLVLDLDSDRIYPLTDNAYLLGSNTRAWIKMYSYDLRLNNLGGSGTRCVQVDNNGDFAIASAICNSGSLTNPMTTTGDMIYSSDNSGTPARLGISGVGGVNFLVQLGSSTPTWQNIIVSSPLSYSSGIFSCSTCVTSVTASGLLSSTGGTTPVISCATCMANPMTTTWDMIYSSSGSTPARIANPTLGGNFFLTSTAAGGPVWTSVLASSPLSYSAGIFSIQQANTSQAGYLSSTDWNTFNGKMSNVLTTTGDMIYSSSGSTAARLAAPGAGVNWIECCSSGIPFWRNIVASSPLSLSSGIFSIGNAAADGSTKGAASFASSDFDASSGNISIDYANGQSASGSVKGFLTSTDWTTFNNKMTNPMTTTYDMIYSSSGSTPARLANPGAGGTWLLLGTSGSAPSWLNVVASSPLSFSAGIWSCSTCVTTNGASQTLSGGFTITGNFYNRSFSGSGVSCSGVSDGWTGWDTSGQYLIMCAGGNRYRVNLASY